MSSSGHRVTVEAVGDAARPAWLEMASGDPGLALTKTPQWADCIRAGSAFTDATLLLRVDGRRVVLPRHALPRLPGVFAAPPNNWNLGVASGGFVTEDGPLRTDQLRALVHEVGRAGLRTQVVVGGDDARAWGPAVPRSVHTTTAVSDVLDLHGGFDPVWADRFSSKVRSASRKAERRGVTIEADSTGRLVGAFDELYRASVDRWARDRNYPVQIMRWRYRREHPRDRLEAVARALGTRCTVYLARQEGQPLAGIIVLDGGAHTVYWRGAMDKQRCRGTGANELLHRQAIESACDQGRRSYDFGLSQLEELRRFKRGFGTHEEPVYTFTLERIPTAAAQARLYQATKRAVLTVAGVARRG